MMKPEQLGREWAARGAFSGRTKQELQHLLDMKLHGIQRVPALQVNDPCKSMQELLDKYEILPTGPLHDDAHHSPSLEGKYSEHGSGRRGAPCFDGLFPLVRGEIFGTRVWEARSAEL